MEPHKKTVYCSYFAEIIISPKKRLQSENNLLKCNTTNFKSSYFNCTN